jgi:hypothetical protein
VDAELHTLVDSNKAADVFEHLVVGGQKADFASNELVSKRMAIQAVNYFAECGRPDPTLSWDTEKS